MKPIEVFYHFFLPNDLRAGAWTFWIDEQIGAIRRSGLSELAKVKMALTMPMFWTAAGNILFHRNGDQNDFIHFHTAVEEYVTTRYPFVEVIARRDCSETNLFEGFTLDLIHKYSQTVSQDTNILYLHTKGITRNSAQTSNWREVLQHFCIHRWANCVRELETHDAVGVTDGSSDHVFSGNVWWARSDYLKRLAPPLETQLYAELPEMWPDQRDYRYAFELWVLTGRPVNPKFVYHTHTNHYGEFLFVENLPHQISQWVLWARLHSLGTQADQ